MKVLELMRYDVRMKLRRPGAMALFCAYTVLLAFAAATGHVHVKERRAALRGHHAEVAANQARLMERVLARESASDVPSARGGASAMDVSLSTAVAPGPLADFSVGQADLFPSFGAITLWAPDVRLFAKYEFGDAVALALGPFDLGQAIIFLLPLMLIALCYDALSDDADSGRLDLLVAQRGSAAGLVWGRFAARFAGVWGTTVFVAGAAMVAGLRPDVAAARLSLFLVWLAAVSSYALFWGAATAFVVSRNGSGQSNALRLTLLWGIIVLLVPAGTTAVAEAIYPTPSRLMYLAQARGQENRALREADHVGERFMVEHPDLVPSSAQAMPAYVRTAYWVTKQVDEATRPALDSFERSARQRRQVLSALGYVSPAAALHQLVNDLAGASSARFRRYQAHAKQFKADFGAGVGEQLLSGRSITSSEVRALPVFRFENETWKRILIRHAGVIGTLLFSAAAMIGLAHRRMVRIMGRSR